MPTLQERAHARLSASGASRWIHCPGSVTAETGLPDSETEYSREGTAAHALAQIAWTRGRPADFWLGETIEDIVVSQEMADAVQVYLDVIAEFSRSAQKTWTEHRVSLAKLRPPEEMFATADFIAIEQTRLRIVDLKYGRGVPVSADKNWQMLYYAVGAWLAVWESDRRAAERVQTITMTIVQPRLFDADGSPMLSHEELSIAELKQRGRELMEHARQAVRPNAMRVAGSWCQFCRAKATCATFRSVALDVVQLEFSDMVEHPAPLVPPDALTSEQLARILPLLPMLSEWVNAVEGYALGELERGRPIPGYALKPKRAMRKWINETQVAEHFQELGEDIYDRSLKSPAQLEKLVGKKQFPAHLVSQVSSGYSLCRDTDKAAVAVAATTFEALSAPETPRKA